MKEYIKPSIRCIELSAEPLMAGSEVVEFRFSTQVNDEWDNDVEKNIE